MKSTGGEYHDSIRIVLRVIVDAEGNDATVEILRPSGIDAADAAALAAVREKSLPAPPVEILDIFGRASVVVSVVLRFD